MELTGKDIQYKEVNETRYKNEIERIIQKYQVIFFSFNFYNIL